jgi:hypothetical protein
MSPYGKGNVEPEGTEKTYGAEQGEGGETGGAGGRGNIGTIGSVGEKAPGRVPVGRGQCSGPWEQRQEAAQYRG